MPFLGEGGNALILNFFGKWNYSALLRCAGWLLWDFTVSEFVWPEALKSHGGTKLVKGMQWDQMECSRRGEECRLWSQDCLQMSAQWPWGSHVTSQSLRFSICKNVKIFFHKNHFNTPPFRSILIGFTTGSSYKHKLNPHLLNSTMCWVQRKKMNKAKSLPLKKLLWVEKQWRQLSSMNIE